MRIVSLCLGSTEVAREQMLKKRKKGKRGKKNKKKNKLFSGYTTKNYKINFIELLALSSICNHSFRFRFPRRFGNSVSKLLTRQSFGGLTSTL